MGREGASTRNTTSAMRMFLLHEPARVSVLSNIVSGVDDDVPWGGLGTRRGSHMGESVIRGAARAGQTD
jgi:hypothetical protein